MSANPQMHGDEHVGGPAEGSATPSRGRVVGSLAPGEDRRAIQAVLLGARNLVLNGCAELLVHGSVGPRGESPAAAGSDPRRALQAEKLGALRHGRLKRYVLAVQTDAGPRVIKISEGVGAGNYLAGLLGTSVSRREHGLHQRAEAQGVAATRSLGFLEWRSGPALLRACQVQTPLPDELVDLDTFLAEELARRGYAALDSLAVELARLHALPFFHADLKGFHAFVTRPQQPEGRPARFRLLWIDLARVAFHMTRRKRIINLYQALRFVVPDRSEAQERFVFAYCRASGWYESAPERGLATVRRFLAFKLRTHPNP